MKKTEEKEAIERLTEEVRKMKWQKEKEERIKKKNNIVITDFKQREQVTAEQIEEFLKKKIGVIAGVDAIWWLYVNNEKAIGAELRSWKDKMKVMENKSKLKEADRKIFIDNDTTIQERNVRRILIAEVKEMRGKGSTVKVGYCRIGIDGRKYNNFNLGGLTTFSLSA